MYLEAKNVVKRYYNHLALNDVSISVEQGSVFGLLGPNGAGKSTLIRIINRITAADQGVIMINGKPLTDKDISRIGYLPEERGLYRKMKVGEQAIYLARLKGISRTEAQKRLKSWSEKFNIMPWWNKKVEELSKGMQQKIQFVCTVIHEPELLIFDEPFSGFDPVNAELLKKEILDLKNKGCTIIFSTHNMASVEEVCNNIALINHSKVVLNGGVQEVKLRYSKDTVLLLLESNTLLEEQAGNNRLHILRQEQVAPHKIKVWVKSKFEDDVRHLINALPTDVRLVELTQELPTMNEIFIQIVQSKETNPNE